jgi:Holliday junction resolvase RusA-like endonuclease
MSRTKNELAFVVPGRAIPAARMTQRSKFACARARRSLEFQEFVAWCARAAAARRPALPFRGPVELTCRFFFRDGRHGDLSNLIKAIEDGLQFGGVIENDRQVIRYGPGTGIYYAEEERTEVRVRELKEVRHEVDGHSVGKRAVRVGNGH